MPLDGALLDLLAGLLVPPEWRTENPGAMGCAAVGPTLQEDPLAVLDTLEGPYVDHDIVIEGDDIVCMSDELLSTPAMTVEEQRAIYASSVVSFFDAHFGDTEEQRRDGCRYLLYEMPKNPAVTLEWHKK